MTADPVDVLVVGAGPAGLTLANCVMLQGMSVRVLDRVPDVPHRESAFLHGKGSEVLQRLGALGSLQDECETVTKTMAYIGKRPMRMQYTTSGLGNPVLPMIISQMTIEKVLRARLAELGATVEWDSGLVDITQDDSGVTATLSNGEQARARWLVGCDGPDSMARKAAGIGFPGTSDRYLLLDAHVDWDLDRDGLTGWLHPDGRVGAMPMIDPGGAQDLWRILARDPQEETEKPTDDEIVARVKTVLAERTPYGGIPLRDTTTKLVFTSHARVADTFRKGRVLLAGDAAHAHVPFGGPAIHSGMADAENLAWKLALVKDGLAGDALLDTYNAERHPIAAEILLGLSTSNKIEQSMRNPFGRFMRDRVVAPLLKFDFINKLTTYTTSRVGETYHGGPLGGASRYARKPRPGDSLPDLECVRLPDRQPTRLYDELVATWVLLVPAGGADGSVSAARQRLGDSRFVVLERAGGAAGNGSAAASQVWLVRPDAHLAWRGQPGSPGLGQWLDGALNHGRVPN